MMGIEIKPKFYKDFRCIADQCTFTCCQEWKIAVDSFANNLQDIYDWLNENEDCGFDMPDKLYVLGDVINLFKSIDVRKMEEAV